MTDARMLARFAGLASTLVSDALDGLDLSPGVAGIGPVWPASLMIGRALPVTLAPRDPSSGHVHIGVDAVAQAESTDVLVMANGGDVGVSCWGGLLSLAASLRGVRGVVVDGACRDPNDAQRLGFGVWARALTPVTAKRRLSERSVGESVSVGATRVARGDLVVADGSGVAFVPAAAALEVLEAAERLAARERTLGDELRAGRALDEVFDDRRLTEK